MTTLADLINDVQAYMSGYGADRDKETSLAAAITDTTSTSFTVADGIQVDRGRVEVDNEVMAVVSSDKTTGLITLTPWGRGVDGSTAITHAVGARVTSNPAFPRSRVTTLLNQCLNDLYPELWSVSLDETNTARPAQVTYAMPANAMSIVSISVKTLGPSKMWAPLFRYRFDNMADTSLWPTGNTVDIYDAMPPGQKIKIVYRGSFGQFTGDNTQTLAAVNASESYRDILQLGVTSKMTGAMESKRLALDTVESAAQAQYTQPTQATSIAHQLWSQYQQRIAEEKARLQRTYPGGIVRLN